MAARTVTNPLEDGWRDYRQAARLPKKDTERVLDVRLAYYASAAHVLAVLVESQLDPALAELLLAEVAAFIADRNADADLVP